MDIRFNTCGYAHESGFIDGGANEVEYFVENCKLRVLGKNILCAHPNLGEVDDIDGMTSRDDFLFLINKLGDKKRSGDIFTLIQILDDFSYLTYKSDYQQRISTTLTERVLFEQNTEFSKSIRELGGKEFQEICSIILRSHKIGTGLNEGEKARIRFLIVRVQGTIEKIIRQICTDNGIEM